MSSTFRTSIIWILTNVNKIKMKTAELWILRRWTLLPAIERRPTRQWMVDPSSELNAMIVMSWINTFSLQKYQIFLQQHWIDFKRENEALAAFDEDFNFSNFRGQPVRSVVSSQNSDTGYSDTWTRWLSAKICEIKNLHRKQPRLHSLFCNFLIISLKPRSAGCMISSS